MQTKLASLIEVITNVLIGYGIAVTAQVFIFPLYGVHLPLSANLSLGLLFTIISVIRSYAVRRWFNGPLNTAAEALANLTHPASVLFAARLRVAVLLKRFDDYLS